MLWLEHRWNYGAANLTPAEFRSAFRFSFEIPEPALTQAAERRRPCGCGARDCGGKVFSTGMQYVYHVLNRKSDTGGGSAYKRHNAINDTVHALAEMARVIVLIGGYSCVMPRDPRRWGEGREPSQEKWAVLGPQKNWGVLNLPGKLARKSPPMQFGCKTSPPVSSPDHVYPHIRHLLHGRNLVSPPRSPQKACWGQGGTFGPKGHGRVAWLLALRAAISVIENPEFLDPLLLGPLVAHPELASPMISSNPAQ